MKWHREEEAKRARETQLSRNRAEAVAREMAKKAETQRKKNERAESKDLQRFLRRLNRLLPVEVKIVGSSPHFDIPSFGTDRGEADPRNPHLFVARTLNGDSISLYQATHGPSIRVDLGDGTCLNLVYQWGEMISVQFETHYSYSDDSRIVFFDSGMKEIGALEKYYFSREHMQAKLYNTWKALTDDHVE